MRCRSGAQGVDARVEHMKSRIWMAGVGLCLVLGGAWPACGTDYYVDDESNAGDLWTPTTLGNDSFDGLTPTTPKATLGNLIGTVALAAGDVVYIDTGTYAPVVISNTVVGTAASNILFQGSTANAGTVFTGSGYIFSVRGQHLRFQDIRVVGGSAGVVLTGASYCEFLRVTAVSQVNWSLRWENASNSNAFRRCILKSTQSIIANAGTCRGNYLENCVAISINEAPITPAAGALSNMVNCIVMGKYIMGGGAYMPDRGSRNIFYSTDGILSTAETMADLYRMSTNWYGNLFADPKVANADTLDFHLLSTVGYLSNGTWQTSTEHSPAIDFGWAGAAVGAETDPNGGRLNVGLYGGTAEASRSRTNAWTYAMAFNDGGSLIQTGRLEWVASTNLAGTDVALEYSTNQWATTNAIATVPATNEFHVWVPGFSHPAVQWRVRDPASGFASTNVKPFSIRATTNATFRFYVNDGSTADDVYCQGIGHADNTGVASNSPVADLRELLKRYDLEGGDTVFVDTGEYLLTQTVAVAIFDSGRSGSPVRIVGSPEGTSLNSANTSMDVMDLSGASHLEIEDLRLTGGRYGLNGGTDAITVRNVEAIANNSGFYVTGSRHSFERCLAADNTAYGFIGTSTASRSNQWNNGVMWGSPTILQVRTNALSVSNSILGGGATLMGNQIVPGDYNLVWNAGVGAAPSFTALQDAGFGWSNSLYADPLFFDATNGDFHVRSAEGRYDPGISGFVQVDTNTSPAIDLGDPAAAFGAEEDPNGDRLNAGLFGGTGQASKSRTNAWIQLASYLNGGTLNAQDGVWVRWNAGAYEPGATVTISISRDNGESWEALTTNVEATAGHYLYQVAIPDNSSSRDALLRVELNGTSPAAESVSPTNFTYRNGTFAFYVNDDSLDGDVYCEAIGDDGNAGSSPGAPMRNLHALIDKLGQLGAGDRIYVDTGVYTATNVVKLTAPFSGAATNPVVLLGSTNRLAGGSLFRSLSGTVPRPLGIDVQPGVSNLIVKDLVLSNVVRGVAMTNVANVTLDGVEVRGATSRAFDLQYLSRSNELIRCAAHGGNIGVYLNNASNVAVRQAVFYENSGNAVYLGASTGLELENSVLASTATNAALISLATTN
ncbi:MAG: right-handed parallel beta-helix repeat-containing protein, partial [Spartobacteria bacterium]|nr:right-handed parallel beta-helix repeat-containing protein [Spartobacteria bacterium]